MVQTPLMHNRHSRFLSNQTLQFFDPFQACIVHEIKLNSKDSCEINESKHSDKTIAKSKCDVWKF